MKKILLVVFIVLSSKIVFSQNENIFKGFGNEPFWDVSFFEKYILFKINSEAEKKFEYTGPFAVNGFQKDFIKIYYMSKDKSSFLLIKQCDGKCSDGMSDERYPYEVILKINDSFYYGCGVYKKK